MSTRHEWAHIGDDDAALLHKSGYARVLFARWAGSPTSPSPEEGLTSIERQLEAEAQQ